MIKDNECKQSPKTKE